MHMFFSRKSSASDLARAAKKAADAKVLAQKPKLAPIQVGVKPGARPEFSDSVSMPLISDMSEIKDMGVYLAFSNFPHQAIASTYEQNFALLVKDGIHVTILSTIDMVWSRPGMELGRRCLDVEFKVRERVACTEDVIKAIHATFHQAAAKNGGIDQSEIQRIAFALVASAVEKDASDIHIETRGAKADVFFRIHGERRLQPMLASETAMQVIRVLYNVHADASSSGTNWDSMAVQDTAIEHVLPNGARVQLRFNSAPIYPAPNVQSTLRVLRMDGDQAAKSIEKVGYTAEMCVQIEEMLVGSTGLVLLVGPTNSGKSTSLQSFIKRIYDRRGKTIKIVTIEDPVEYVIDAACQMGVSRGRNTEEASVAEYRDLLASTLRQDPDVALVGEIRNSDQATPVKDMVLAGRKILSTLHAYEASAVFARLREIGIPESLLTRQGFISGIIYQRLVPTLCSHCSIPFAEAHQSGRMRDATYERVLRAIDSTVHDVRARSECGCMKCNYTGITGRTPCAEILVPDEAYLRFIRAQDEIGAKDYWYKTGINTDGAGVTAIAHAISKMRQGLLDPTDIEVQIGQIVIDRIGAGISTDFGAPTSPGLGNSFFAEDLLGLGGRNSSFHAEK